MKIKTIIGGFASLILSLTMLVGCSSQQATLVPEDILNKAVDADKKNQKYYAEYKIDVYENDKLIEASTIKEWTDGKNRRRAECIHADDTTISVNDGKTITIYMQKAKTAMVTESSSLGDLYGQSPKENLIRDFSIIEKSHDISLKGEENINGIDTYHISAKPKKTDSLMGNVNMWIDKKTWFTVKTSSEAAGSKIDLLCTKLDFEPEISDDLFKIQLPKNVKVQNLDELAPKENAISLEEAVKEVGEPILYYSEKDPVFLKKITSIKFDNRPAEINQDYGKGNIVAFTLNVWKAPADNNKDISDTGLPNEKSITIRGQKGLISTDEQFRCIRWQENGIKYSVLINDPNITSEDIIKIVEKMVYTK